MKVSALSSLRGRRLLGWMGVFCVFTAPLHAQAASGICDTTGWQPNYPGSGDYGCGGTSQGCKRLKGNLIQYNKEYNAIAKAACDADKAIKIDSVTQNGSKDQVLSQIQKGRSSIEALQAKNKELMGKVPQESRNVVNEVKQLTAGNPSLAPAVRETEATVQEWQQKKDLSQKEIKREALSSVSGVPSAQKPMQALESADSFMKHLRTQREKNNAAIAQLDSMKSRLEGTQGDGNQNNNTDSSPGGGGGGFDLSSLLPLAAPLAGLAMMAQQKKNAEDSGLSEATPTPPPTAAPSPEAASLNGSETKGTSSGQVKVSPTGTTPPSANTPYIADAFTGVPNSEVTAPSNGSEGFRGGGAGGSGGLLGGFSGGGSFGGGGNSSGASSAKSDDGRDLASNKPAEETLAFSGGGGGGLNFTPSTTPGAEEHAATDPLLNAMETAIEDPNLSLASFHEDAPTVQGANEIAAQDSEFLFSRVKACYQRNVKKGLVLSGLGEKIGE